MDLKKVGTIAYMILMVFYGIYTMVLSIQAYTKFQDSSQEYLNIAANLKQPYVIDMISTSSNSCTSGYESLFAWDWQGTYVGCDCTSSTLPSADKIVNMHACNSTETYRGCTAMNTVSSQMFSSIQGSSTTSPMSICFKRADSSKAFYRIADSQTGVCSSTQKTCGNTSQQETIVCVDSSEPCPIYGYQVSTPSNTATYPTTEWKEVNLPTGQSMYVNIAGSSATALPKSEFRFTQGSGVCAYDNTIAENLYHSLNIPSNNWTAMATWPGYQTPTSTELFKSYTREFISWKVSERSKMFDFVDSASSISNLKTAQLVVMAVNIIVCLMVSIVLSFSQVYNLLGKDVPCISGKGEEEQKRIVLIKKVLGYGGKLLQIPFLLWAFILSAQKKGILNGVADAEVSSTEFNGQIKSFATQIEDNVYKKNLTSMIILGITLLVDLLLFVKGKYDEKKSKNNPEKETKEGGDESKENNKKKKYKDEENQELNNNQTQFMNQSAINYQNQTQPVVQQPTPTPMNPFPPNNGGQPYPNHGGQQLYPNAGGQYQSSSQRQQQQYPNSQQQTYNQGQFGNNQTNNYNNNPISGKIDNYNNNNYQGMNPQNNGGQFGGYIPSNNPPVQVKQLNSQFPEHGGVQPQNQVRNSPIGGAQVHHPNGVLLGQNGAKFEQNTGQIPQQVNVVSYGGSAQIPQNGGIPPAKALMSPFSGVQFESTKGQQQNQTSMRLAGSVNQQQISGGFETTGGYQQPQQQVLLSAGAQLQPTSSNGGQVLSQSLQQDNQFQQQHDQTGISAQSNAPPAYETVGRNIPSNYQSNQQIDLNQQINNEGQPWQSQQQQGEQLNQQQAFFEFDQNNNY